MTQTVRVATLLSLSAATLLASGYRIPEQSLNSVALSAAYVASANGADASYYNPANMAFMAEGGYIETSLTYINLSEVSFEGVSSSMDGDSKKEEFLLPNLHYVSPKMGNWRYGLSIVAPAGLSKRWDESFAKASSEEFTLKVIEVNPTVSYLVNEQLSLGFGLRGVYTDGVVKSDASGLGSQANRDLTGDSIDFGYNLALSYKPIKDVTLAATYRSKVDLSVEGDATLVNGMYNGGASVTIPLPASLALAAAYTYEKTTVEFVFERTYWSSYKDLDFNYDVDLTATAMAGFDNPIAKNWKDANAYRIGLSHQCTDNLKMMLGFAIDKSPVPSNTLGFELPDSDAKLYSIGFEYAMSQNLKVGLAYLYDDKEDRTVSNYTGGTSVAPSGTFTDSSAHLLTASLKYKF